MATGDVYRVTLNSTGQGSVYQSTFALALKTGSGPDAVTFSTFVTDYLTSIKPLTHNTISWTDWAAVQLWGSGMSINRPKCTRIGGLTFNGTLSGQTGALSADALPPQNALVVTLTTGQTGRRYRGRLFLGGQAEASQNDGLWISTHVNATTTAFNTISAKYFKGTGTSTELKMVIWSERIASGCVPATPPAKGHVNVDTPDPDNADTDITGFVVRNVVYSQRRRTRGVGR